MDGLFRFAQALRRDPEVDAWMAARPGDLGDTALHWFQVMRGCGDDVRELLHDGHPTACVEDAAFAYVDAFSSHVNVGFYRGAELPDPAGLLTGDGKRMRHVKITRDGHVDARALEDLVREGYADMRARLSTES